MLQVLLRMNRLHRRRKVKNIAGGGGGGGGEARFRILGGPKGGQIPSRHMTSY